MAEQAALLPGTLDVLILKSVSLGPLHGYAVLARIEQITQRRAPRRTGRALPRALPSRASGAARHRVGHVRQQPPREVLQSHRGGTEAAPRGNRELESSRDGDVVGVESASVRRLRRRHVETDSGPSHARRSADGVRTRHGRRDAVSPRGPHRRLDPRRAHARGRGAARARWSSARWRNTRRSPARARASGCSTKRAATPATRSAPSPGTGPSPRRPSSRSRSASAPTRRSSA